VQHDRRIQTARISENYLVDLFVHCYLGRGPWSVVSGS
jgi:hypothetical protein